MRLPQIRDRILIAHHRWQLELFEAYEVAIETREVMRLNPSEADLFEEYSRVCLEIERDVVDSMQGDTFNA
jgi:hypothetical protein